MTWLESEVEVVSRAVEVDGEEVDAREAVLLPVALEHDEERLLGDAVGGVGLLGVAVPEVVFAEGDRRELGVRADGAELDELAQVLRGGVRAARLDELDAHEGVVVEEAAGVEAVGADAPDLRREVDDDVRAGRARGASRRRRGRGGRTRSTGGAKTTLPADGAQPLDEVAPEEAVAAGDEVSGCHETSWWDGVWSTFYTLRTTGRGEDRGRDSDPPASAAHSELVGIHDAEHSHPVGSRTEDSENPSTPGPRDRSTGGGRGSPQTLTAPPIRKTSSPKSLSKVRMTRSSRAARSIDDAIRGTWGVCPYPANVVPGFSKRSTATPGKFSSARNLTGQTAIG